MVSGILMVLVGTGTAATNSVPGYCRVIDPDMALNNSPGPENTWLWMTVSTQYGSGGSMTLRHPDGHRFWSRTWASMWFLLAALAIDISTDPGCGRTIEPDMILAAAQA